jgi:sedoheptulose-bisphosphatase
MWRQAARPATSFYGESLRANTGRTTLPARQSKAASRAALTTRCAIGDRLVRVVLVHPWTVGE